MIAERGGFLGTETSTGFFGVACAGGGTGTGPGSECWDVGTVHLESLNFPDLRAEQLQVGRR